MENLIGKKVRISCPIYKNGRTFYGVVKSIKKQTTAFTTYNVLIDGNSRTTSFSDDWLTDVEQRKPITNDIIRKITKKEPFDISIINYDTIIGFRILGSAAVAVKKLITNGFNAESIAKNIIMIKNISYTI